MSDDKRDQDVLRDGARQAARVVGGAGRRLAKGLREMTRRPDDGEEAASDEDLGGKVRELGRDFLDVMGKVSVTAGKKIRRAAYDAGDTVRGAIDAARAGRTDDDPATDSDTAAGDSDPDDSRD